MVHNATIASHVTRFARSRIALALAVLAAAGALVIVAPSLHRVQWMARLALRETSLILLPIAVAGACSSPAAAAAGPPVSPAFLRASRPWWPSPPLSLR